MSAATKPVMSEDVERAQFAVFMERHVAQLMNFAKPYIGRLVPEQREQFLAFALDKAWENRAELKPRKTGYSEDINVAMLRWWEDNCLRPAALSKKEWRLRTWDRRVEIVPGRLLGRGG